MKNWIRFATLLLCVLYVNIALLGQTHAVGAWLGMSSYNGDLTEKALNFQEIHPGGGLFAQLEVNEIVSARFAFSLGKLSGSDAHSTDPNKIKRNLSFESSLFEGNFILVVEPLGNERTISPYLFGGWAIFRFNPKTTYQGQLVELQPLGTEGQNLAPTVPRKYQLTELALPLGVGVKYRTNFNVDFGLEMGYRFALTDYIDDVSRQYFDRDLIFQEYGELALALADRSVELGEEPFPAGAERGNSEVNDGYWLAGITVGYRLFGGSRKVKYDCVEW
ncbi:MAG: DUF6089 family protein [Chitinophagales bacterium]